MLTMASFKWKNVLQSLVCIKIECGPQVYGYILAPALSRLYHHYWKLSTSMPGLTLHFFCNCGFKRDGFSACSFWSSRQHTTVHRYHWPHSHSCPMFTRVANFLPFVFLHTGVTHHSAWLVWLIWHCSSQALGLASDTLDTPDTPAVATLALAVATLGLDRLVRSLLKLSQPTDWVIFQRWAKHVSRAISSL